MVVAYTRREKGVDTRSFTPRIRVPVPALRIEETKPMTGNYPEARKMADSAWQSDAKLSNSRHYEARQSTEYFFGDAGL